MNIPNNNYGTPQVAAIVPNGVTTQGTTIAQQAANTLASLNANNSIVIQAQPIGLGNGPSNMYIDSAYLGAPSIKVKVGDVEVDVAGFVSAAFNFAVNDLVICMDKSSPYYKKIGKIIQRSSARLVLELDDDNKTLTRPKLISGYRVDFTTDEDREAIKKSVTTASTYVGSSAHSPAPYPILVYEDDLELAFTV
jgi:hypothetical protein